MAPKRPAEELFQIHKRAKVSHVPPTVPPSASSIGVEGAPPPSPPNSPVAESSTARIWREAVEEFKESSEFRDLSSAAEVKGLVEGFYVCRGWISAHYPRLDLTHYAFSIIPRRFCFPPFGYLEEAEAAIERRRFEEDAQRAAGLDVLEPEDVTTIIPPL